jgi:hypothetical protein
MRKLLAVAACGVGIWTFGACGGGDGSSGGSISDPVDGCKQANHVVCEKIFGCFTTDELNQPLFKMTFGLNAADCATKFDAECTPDKQNCAAGETFHADKANDCLDGYKKFNCDDVKAQPPIAPAACDQICTK